MQNWLPFNGVCRTNVCTGLWGYMDAVRAGALLDGARDLKFIPLFFNTSVPVQVPHTRICPRLCDVCKGVCVWVVLCVCARRGRIPTSWSKVVEVLSPCQALRMQGVAVGVPSLRLQGLAACAWSLLWQGSSTRARNASVTSPPTIPAGVSSLAGLVPDNTWCGGNPKSAVCTSNANTLVVYARNATQSSAPLRLQLPWASTVTPPSGSAYQNILDARCFNPTTGTFDEPVVTAVGSAGREVLVQCPGSSSAGNTDRVVRILGGPMP